MILFEKIKTASDKRYALAKRNNKPVAHDYLPGDRILFSEKVDGYNTSFNLNKDIASRKGIITDWSHHTPLAKMQDLLTDELIELIKAYPHNNYASGNFQFFGEYMVENRLIPYQDFVYDSFYMFDIYDIDQDRYLGIRAAAHLVEYLQQNLKDDAIKARLLTPNILDDAYIFDSYEAMEAYARDVLSTSKFSISGVSEGVVTSNLSRKIPSEIRTKIVNQDYKEVQRAIQKPARTAALRWLMTYLNDARVKKHILNLEIEGVIDVTQDTYYTSQLQTLVEHVEDDIFTEAVEIIDLSAADRKDITNKIEGFSRLLLIEYKTYHN